MPLFAQLAQLAEFLASEPSRLKKRAAIANALATLQHEPAEAGRFCLYLAGQPFPEADARNLNAGGAILSRALKSVSGATDAAMTAAYRRHGDLGAAAHDLLVAPYGHAPANPTLTLAEIATAFDAMASARTTAARAAAVEALLRRATALEAKYLLKLMLGDMRIGTKQSLIEEGIAVAANVTVEAVRHAVMLEADLARAVIRAFACTLAEARMTLFHPLGFMLASPVETPEEAVDRFTPKPPKSLKPPPTPKRRKNSSLNPEASENNRVPHSFAQRKGGVETPDPPQPPPPPATPLADEANPENNRVPQSFAQRKGGVETPDPPQPPPPTATPANPADEANPEDNRVPHSFAQRKGGVETPDPPQPPLPATTPPNPADEANPEDNRVPHSFAQRKGGVETPDEANPENNRVPHSFAQRKGGVEPPDPPQPPPPAPIHAFLEDKFDGIRAQLHCGDPAQPGRVALYSRSREDITAAFPEIAEACTAIDAPPGGLILDGEILGWDPVAGQALPFAILGGRIGRKNVSDDLRQTIPVIFMAFDLLYADGDLQLPQPLHARRARLEAIVAALQPLTHAGFAAPPQTAQHALFATAEPPSPPMQRLRLSRAERVESAEAVDRGYRDARARANEGVMLKAAASAYLPGRRGLAWLKLKRELATLDVVITGAEFGSGKRAQLLSDYTFSVRGPDGNLLTLGKAYQGVTDAEIAELTAWLHAHTLEDFGHFRTVEPLRVLEVAFNNIMRSDRHNSGFALRFPRILRLRDDKPVAEIDTLARVAEVYASQPDKPTDAKEPAAD